MVFALLPLALASCARDQRAPDTWLDTNGQTHAPLATANRRATVLLFIGPECPISNAYAPEVARIVEHYGPQGVALFAVHADPSVTPADAARHARDYGYPCPVLLDPAQELVSYTGATMTPQASVLDVTGKVVYLGRIDDLFYGFGRRRAFPTRRDLRDAIDAVLAGQPVPPASGDTIGCEIAPAVCTIPLLPDLEEAK